MGNSEKILNRYTGDTGHETDTPVKGILWKIKNYDLSDKELSKIDLFLDDSCTCEDFEKFLKSKYWVNHKKYQSRAQEKASTNKRSK